MPRISARGGGVGRWLAGVMGGPKSLRLREDSRPRADRRRPLARTPRARHRSHRLQGGVAVAVAAVARRSCDRPRPGRPHAAFAVRARACGRPHDTTRGRRPRCAGACCEVVGAEQPEVVFHLAAQPMVRRSLLEPAMTYEVNVMGTVNVLEAVRARRRRGAGGRDRDLGQVLRERRSSPAAPSSSPTRSAAATRTRARRPARSW